MKRQYQIEAQRAVQQFRRLAIEQNPNIQMVLPVAEIVSLLQQGVGRRGGPMQAGVWDKMMRGLSTRNYGAVVKDFHDAYGIEKSAVSENFLEASREKLKEPMERPLGQLRLCAVRIDGTPFKDRQMMVALGMGCDGSKTVLGIREGATENAAVVNAGLSELVEPGLDFSTPGLYILDGGQALHAAVRRHAGEAAFIQPCQVHKKRNGVDPLAEEHKADLKRKLPNAYAMVDYTDAKPALERVHRELLDLNPSAARSLEEGMEETLTVHQLRVPDPLRRTLGCTNVIESAFSIVETVGRNVKRWRPGDRIERWVGSALLVAERQFRRVIRHRHIPLLLSSMANAVSKKPMPKGAAVA
jgi:putative transposase